MKPAAREIFRDPVHLLAFGFGAGLSPAAPGTAGTLITIPLVAATWSLPLGARVAIAVVLIVAGVWICGASARKLGVHDFGGIVWDEIAGFYLVMLLVPVGWWWMLAGFVVFRFFDVAKPWPIATLDRRVPGGTGIMLDDLIAALFAAAALWLGHAAWTYFA